LKNKFTISISDVHGVKDYSFNQVMRKFAWIFLLVILLTLIIGGGVIWWLNQQVEQIEQKRAAEEQKFAQTVTENQKTFAQLQAERRKLQQELMEKSKQLSFLNQTLDGLEDLIGVQPNEDAPIVERVKSVQLTTLEKSFILQMTPSGRPVQKFQGVSSSYGWRTHPVTGEKEFHRGIDYRGKKGDPVIATADGVVEYSGYHKKSGYGNMILLTHDNGFKTLYGHMSKRLVQTGETVKKGQIIGQIGSTGLSSGNHLHYEVSFVQRKLNPSPFVNWRLDNFDEIKKVKGVPWGSLGQVIKERVEKVEKQLLLRGASSEAKSAN
jgi:murein DD-endopeptidase MepM/ murein hydrolase activator NlpD